MVREKGILWWVCKEVGSDVDVIVNPVSNTLVHILPGLLIQVAEQPYEQLGEGLKGKVDQALKSAEKESKVEKKMKQAAVKKNNPKVSPLSRVSKQKRAIFCADHSDRETKEDDQVIDIWWPLFIVRTSH